MIVEAMPVVQVASSWNLRAIDILITILLTVLIGLSTWALKTVLTHADRFEKVGEALGRINQQLWGVDGKNGHASEIRGFRRALEELGDTMADFEFRLRRVEERHGIDTPTAHPKYRRSKSDDAEDD